MTVQTANKTLSFDVHAPLIKTNVVHAFYNTNLRSSAALHARFKLILES